MLAMRRLWTVLVGAVACLLAPMPWGAFAAVAVLAATVLALGRVPGPQAVRGHDRQDDRDAPSAGISRTT